MNEQITAYVLNELGAKEREAFESELQTNPELQKKVEEMRTFCTILDQHIEKAPAADFTSEQRNKLLESFQTLQITEVKDAPKGNQFRRRSLLKNPVLLTSAALAACIAIMSVVLMNDMRTLQGDITGRPLPQVAASSVPPPPMPAAPFLATPGYSTRASKPPANGTYQVGDIPDEAAGTYAPAPVDSLTMYGRNYHSAESRFMAPPTHVPSQGNTFSDENYQRVTEGTFKEVAQQPLSTFSVHTDGASYANVRRFLNYNQRPPLDAVRIEELINYFPYEDEPPANREHPFAVHVDIREAPWQPLHRLARIAVKGFEVQQDRKPANLVFLIDVSGSMNEPRKLPLVKQSLEMLVQQLHDTDRVAIVTYAGDSSVTLESTPASEKNKILEAIEKLNAAGSTNGAGGLKAAYQQARNHFLNEGINRVILCSDGDFNVGINSPDELEKLISKEAKSRVFLSVLGFGTGNLNDHLMETLATKGNGNHAYIDSLSEARKVLVEQLNSTLMTIAKDVKIQVEFNPAQVSSYRLIGYENRMLQKEDFNNDKKDAGEIGAGHTVVALYEIVPTHVKYPNGKPLVDELKYAPKKSAQSPPVAAADAGQNTETMTVKLRYKQPEGDVSQLVEVPVTDRQLPLKSASNDFKFSAAVAGFGLLLRNSEYAGDLTWEQVRDLALQGKGADPLGYRGEFIQLIDKARSLTR